LNFWNRTSRGNLGKGNGGESGENLKFGRRFFFFPIWVLKVNNGMRGRTTRVKFTELTISTSLR